MDIQKSIERLNRDFTGYIRVYRYSDPNMGYGDGGTVGFFEVKKEWFTTENTGFAPYKLKSKILKELNLSLMDNGYKFVDKEEMKETYHDNLKSIEKLKKQNKSLNILLSK